MAINVYTGRMGSGKTFEVVREVVLPAILSGRRVVSNIRGLNEKLIHDYLRKHNKQVGELGSVLLVEDDDVLKPGFFYSKEMPESVVRRGDLVVIDEAWRFWIKGSASKMTEQHMEFFRMHRHYVDENGTPCDMALIFQSITDVHPFIRSVIELTTRTVKLKTLGLHSKYRVEIYEGDRIHKNTRVRNIARTYDKRIFPLYQSYAGGDGKEVVVDDRQNVFKNKLVFVGLAVVLVMFFFSARTLSRLFSPEKKPEQGVLAVADGVQAGAVDEMENGRSAVGSGGYSSEHRHGGTVFVNDQYYAVVLDRRGVYRLVESEIPGRVSRLDEVVVEGRNVAPFSGDGGIR